MRGGPTLRGRPGGRLGAELLRALRARGAGRLAGPSVR